LGKGIGFLVKILLGKETGVHENTHKAVDILSF
jgi:hypothetical protein